MADQKISQLTAATTPLAGTEVVPVLQGGVNRRTTVAEIRNGAMGPTGPAGADGADGREVELQTNATHVQWRYVGSPTWTDLIALAAITGPSGADGIDGSDGADGANGQNIELQVSATHIQWRYVGDATWTDLVALSAITGPQGANATYSDATPQPLGTAAAGTTAAAARADHVHAMPSAADVGAAASGAVGSSGLTMATARLLGRTTASTGAIEEISIGSGLTLSGGALSASGATPGGTSGQFQYNNGGVLAGVSTMTFDGTSVTLAGRLINSYNSAASAPAKVFTGTWFTGGTATTTKPHFLIEPAGTTSTAWSTSGTGLGVNAASGFAGNLLDLQVNGSTRFSVDGAEGIAYVEAIRKSRAEPSGTVTVGGVALSPFLCGIQGSGAFGIAGGGNPAAADTLLGRDSSGVFAQRNGTNAQIFRVYNTFASATNHERGKLAWNANVFEIGTEKGTGGGTARDMVFQTDGTTRITLKANGAILFSGLPTSDPAVAGQLWNDGNTLKISAG